MRKQIRRILRVLVSIATAVLLISFSAIGLLYTAINTEAGTKLLLNHAKRIYNNLIPGEIEFAQVSGTLGRSFQLSEVVLKNKDGMVFVRCKTVGAIWYPASLVMGQARVEELYISTGEVFLMQDNPEADFADLAPSSSDETEEDSPIEIDLPIQLYGHLLLRDISIVFQNSANLPQLHSRLDNLFISLWAEGLNAVVEANDISGTLPSPFYNLSKLGFMITRNGQSVLLEKFDLKTDALDVFIPQAYTNLSDLSLHTELFSKVHSEKLSSFINIPFDINPALHLTVSGSLKGFESEVQVNTDSNSTIIISLKGNIKPAIELKAALRLSQIDPLTLKNASERELSGTGEFVAKGKSLETLSVKADFNCDKCLFPGIGLLLASLKTEFVQGNGKVSAKIEAEGLNAQIRTDIENYQLKDLGFNLGIQDIRTASVAVSDLVKLPQIGGSLSAEGLCKKTDDKLNCKAAIAGNDISVDSVSTKSMSISAEANPFDDLIPFDSTIRISKVRVGKESLGDLRVKVSGNKNAVSGNLNINSSAHQTNANLSTSVSLGDTIIVDTSKFSLKFRNMSADLIKPSRIEIANENIRLGTLNLALLRGTLLTSGTLNLSGANNLKLEIEKINLGQLNQLLPSLKLEGQLSCRATVEGETDSLSSIIRLTAKDLSVKDIRLGNLLSETRFRPGRLSGFFDLSNGIAERANINFLVGAYFDPKDKGFYLPLKDNRSIRASIDKLEIKKPIEQLLNIKASGTVDVSAGLEGSGYDPRISAKLEAKNLGWMNIDLGQAYASFTYESKIANILFKLNSFPIKDLQLSAEIPLKIDNTVTWLKYKSHHLDMSLSDVDLESVTKLSHDAAPNIIPTIPVSGTLNAIAKLSGNLDSLESDLYLNISELSVKDKELGNGSLRAGIKDNIFHMHAQIMDNPNQYFDIKAALPFALDVKNFDLTLKPLERHEFEAKFWGIDKELVSAFTNMPWFPDFRVAGNVKAFGKFGDFNVKGAVHGDVTLPNHFPIRLHGDISAAQNKQTLKLLIGPQTSPLAIINAETALPESIISEHKLNPLDLPIKARLDIPTIDLRPFTTMLPNVLYKLEGFLKGSLEASGTIKSLKTSGRLQLEKGAVTVTELNQRLRDIKFNIDVIDKKVSMNNLQFTTGSGSGNGEFYLELKDNMDITGFGRLNLRRFPVVRPGLPEALVSGAIDTKVDLTKTNTEVALKFRNMDVRVITTGGGPTPRDIRMGTRTEVKYLSREEEPIEAVSNDSKIMKLSLDFNEPIDIRGTGIEMQWRGETSVLLKDQSSKISGSIAALPGRFELMGNLFEIESGYINFPSGGKLDPFIDLTALCDTSEAVITVTIRGRLSRPDLILSSNPNLSQYQIVALLATGKSDTTNAGNNDMNIQASAASLLLAFNNPTLERQLYEKLGIDRLGIALGDTIEEPILVVGKRFGRRVYIETKYHHNAPPKENKTAGRVELRVTPEWSIETEYGDAQKGEVGVTWRKRFGKKKRISADKQQ